MPAKIRYNPLLRDRKELPVPPMSQLVDDMTPGKEQVNNTSKLLLLLLLLLRLSQNNAFHIAATLPHLTSALATNRMAA